MVLPNLVIYRIRQLPRLYIFSSCPIKRCRLLHYCNYIIAQFFLQLKRLQMRTQNSTSTSMFLELRLMLSLSEVKFLKFISLNTLNKYTSFGIRRMNEVIAQMYQEIPLSTQLHSLSYEFHMND